MYTEELGENKRKGTILVFENGERKLHKLHPTPLTHFTITITISFWRKLFFCFYYLLNIDTSS